MSIFAIEVGEYSDYHIVGVFSTRENAEVVLPHIKEYGAEIVEWTLDPAVDQLRAGLTCWYIQMLRDGTVREVKPASEFSIEGWEHIYPQKQINEDCRGLRIYGFAKDAEHMVKIANEKRIQAIAEGKWPEQ